MSRLQVSVPVKPGACKVFHTRKMTTTTDIALEYILPIRGHVSLWLEEAKNVSGSETRNYWQVPVKELLQIAKVAHWSPYLT